MAAAGAWAPPSTLRGCPPRRQIVAARASADPPERRRSGGRRAAPSNGSKPAGATAAPPPPPAPPAAAESSLPSDAEVVPLAGVAAPGAAPGAAGDPQSAGAADPRFAAAGVRRVLVAGATGGVGAAVVRLLLRKGVAVRALVRDRAKAARLLPAADPALEVVAADVYSQYEALARAAAGCDAVVCATGPTDRLNPLAPFCVDFRGTENLVAAAARAAPAGRFVLVTSIGVDDPLFPLNALWGVLFAKKQGELALQRSGLDYCILRPGGLVGDGRGGGAPGGRGAGAVVAAGPDAFGLPPRRRPGSIARAAVAEGAVEALVEPAAARKVVELVAEAGAPRRAWAELFAGVE